MKRRVSRSTVYRLRKSTGLDVVRAYRGDRYGYVKRLVLRDGSLRRLDTFGGYCETPDEYKARLESYRNEVEFRKNLFCAQRSPEGQRANAKLRMNERKQWNEINRKASDLRVMEQEPQWQYP